MNDTLTPGYALNVLYSYAFDAPATKKGGPGLNDIDTALSVLRDTIAQLAERDQQLAALREARDTLCECIHDVEPDDFRACGTCWLTLDSAILALLAPQAVDGFDSTAPRLRFDSAAATLAYLTADDDPAAAPDDEIRMPMTPGIPGVGVVVSAGPRPELVLEDDPPAGEEDTPA